MALGIRPGGALFVHSSIKAIGPDVRAQELIAALLAAVGEESTVLMPTFTSRKEKYFDPENTPSSLGIVTEVFRKMPGTIRSRHPYHPVAAQGPAAQELLKDHKKAPTSCGRDTPFQRHAEMNGQVLLIGVDLNELTLLHTAEARVDLAYLRELDADYLNADGDVKKVKITKAPGGDRGGVCLFEKPLRDKGLIRYGQIGNAKTMLMDAAKVLDAMVELMRTDPVAALCRGDYCPDCVDFKSKIRARQLTQLGAKLSVLLPVEPVDPESFKEMLVRFGTGGRFTVVGDLNIVKLRPGQTPPPRPDGNGEWILQPAPQDLIKLEAPPTGYAGFAYSPLEAAKADIHPFHGVLYKQKCRDYVTDIFVEDGTANIAGVKSPAMRMRNFHGRYHLVVPAGDNLYSETLRLLKEFWSLLP